MKCLGTLLQLLLVKTVPIIKHSLSCQSSLDHGVAVVPRADLRLGELELVPLEAAHAVHCRLAQDGRLEAGAPLGRVPHQLPLELLPEDGVDEDVGRRVDRHQLQVANCHNFVLHLAGLWRLGFTC